MKIQTITGDMAWAILNYNALINKSFKSVTGIEYSLNIIQDCIQYRGDNRNKGLEEEISKDDFIKAYEAIKAVDTEINTNTIRNLMPKKMYRKRTPFIGLLYSNQIIK